MSKKFMRYGLRNSLLRKLGFANYSEYLASTLWAEIRSAVLVREPNCVCCDTPAVNIHHLKYTEETLLCRAGSKSLIPLCRACHRGIEVDNAGIKESLYDTHTRLICQLTEAGRCDRAAAVARTVGRQYQPSWFSGGIDAAKAGVIARKASGKRQWKGAHSKRNQSPKGA